MNVIFLSHPYHRGGVTQWMANAFNAWNKSLGNAFFISVTPAREFISGDGKPLLTTLLNQAHRQKIFTSHVDRYFELGTVEYRACQYQKLMHSKILPGTPVIPSDDEACWMAAASMRHSHPVVGILHSDEETYFERVKKYGKFVDYFICVSRRIFLKLIDGYPDYKTRSIIIPCGIFIDEFVWNQPKKEIITWIGRLSVYQKRAQDIIPLFEMVRSKFQQIQLIILGDGYYMSQLQNKIRISGLGDCVNTPGWVALGEIRKMLTDTKIFLQTSDFEGTSIAMMEALASGCIVVSTRVSGVEDLEKLPEAKGVVYLYDVGNIQEAEKLIRSILTKTNSGIASKARQLAIDYFDIHKTNEKLLHFLETKATALNRHHAFQISEWSIFVSPYLSIMRSLKWRFSRFLKQG